MGKGKGIEGKGERGNIKGKREMGRERESAEKEKGGIERWEREIGEEGESNGIKKKMRRTIWWGVYCLGRG